MLTPAPCKSTPIMLYALLCLLSCVSNTCTADEYVSDRSASPAVTVASSVTSSAARSDIECAAMCSASSSASCQACAFSPATGACLMAPKYNADFALAPTSVVYRKPVNASWFRDAYVQIGARNFRIVQHRSKGSLSFARNWTDYEDGFGDDTDFWLGLRTLNELTGSTSRLLRVEAVTWAGVLYISEFSGFTVGAASTKYTMSYSTYQTDSSNASSDSLSYHKATKFSTLDSDSTTCSCPANSCGGGGWWYKCCSYSNPSGQYHTSAVVNGEKTMYWTGAGDVRAALKSIRLMLLA